VIAALLAATGSMARERGLKALVLAPRSQVSGCDSVQPIARRRTISVLRRPVGEPRWTEL
jgi:hypothetical protein